MSDSPLSDDELISSYLDNEVTSDERALVERRLAAEPAFAARVRELQGAAALAATPVTPLSAAATDDLIGAALAASTTTAANVTDLAAAGASRGRSAWKGKLVAAAAVAAALVIAIPVVNNLSDDDSEDFATSADADATGDGADDGFAADSMVEEMGDADGGDDSAGEAETSAAFAEGDDMAAEGDDMADDAADDTDDMGDEDTSGVDAVDDATADDGDADPTTTTGAGSLATARARLSAALSVSDDIDDTTFFRITPAAADFATSDDALAAAEQQWTEFVDLGGTTGSVPPSSLNGADLDQLDDLARVRLIELGACATLLERLRDHVIQLPGPPLVDDADVARITVDGRAATLVVVAFVSGTAEAVLIPDDTCVVEASRSLG